MDFLDCPLVLTESSTGKRAIPDDGSKGNLVSELIGFVVSRPIPTAGQFL